MMLPIYADCKLQTFRCAKIDVFSQSDCIFILGLLRVIKALERCTYSSSPVFTSCLVLLIAEMLLDV